MASFRTLEKRAFKAMLHTFDKQYELPGRTYFSKTAVSNLYNQVKDEILNDLKDIDHFLLTTDMWSSVNMTPYMSVTIHYLTSDWSLKACCLETVYMPDNHTADNLAEGLRSTLINWSLDETKLSCITTDNGANIVAAVRQLGWQWLNCFGHDLHLAVTNAVAAEKDTGRALGMCRTLVGTFSHSWLKKRDLRKAQTELQLPQHSLVVDCATRWGTKQKMIERILEQAPAIRRVLADDRRHQHLNLKWQDIHILDQSDTILTENLKNIICSILEEKYRAPELQNLLNKAALLDPRYKGNGGDCDETKDAILQEILHVREDGEEGGDQGRAGASTGADDESTPPAPKKMKLGELLKKRKGPSQTTAPVPKTVRADTEMTRYLQEEALDSSADPLVWWRDNRGRYPLLVKTSRKL
ncbi:hypothetical protein SKAU_G00278630 [Synaphobranchus kaupii]|uniref:HAT C-terminal dimerisation domain-containing protein n=1 Tax=Synaphobranchus kaupii TaxID=118154 RepID=A0A9Q1ILM1_SYNKA|nr:hypothetical protein SKAU_G00278630 [Synaphobranchus kaupii]